MQIELTEDFFYYKNDKIEGKLIWSCFIKAEVDNNYIYLFTNPIRAFVIPKKQIDKKTLDDTLMLINSKIKTFK